jgi:hypothetical protein
MSGFDFTDKVMFVTGGACGSALCRRFASGGALDPRVVTTVSLGGRRSTRHRGSARQVDGRWELAMEAWALRPRPPTASTGWRRVGDPIRLVLTP